MRRTIAALAIAAAAFVGGGVVIDTATAQPAQASTEISSTTIFNDTNAPIWVTVGSHFNLLESGGTSQRYSGQAKSFSTPSNWCGRYTINYGVRHPLDGTVRVPKNSIVHVYRLRCPNGEWTENFG
jgi:hypothetical protein